MANGLSENLFLEAIDYADYATKTKTLFNVSNFGGDFYEVQKKGTGYVIRTLSESQKLVPKGEGNLMPLIIHRTKDLCIDVGITRNVIFLTRRGDLDFKLKKAF